jgi:hypothetical protein
VSDISNQAVLEFCDDRLSSELNEKDIPHTHSPLPTPHSTLTAQRVAWLAVLLSTAGLLATMAWPMFVGQVYTADDLGWFHLPMRSFYSQQLARSEPFDWCPDLYCGFYLTGEGQVGSYHPLHWLLYRLLPLPLAFDLECWLSYPFMLVGMYLFLRRWKLRPAAAGFGSLVFTFGSFNLLHFIHMNAVAIVAHLPWTLWAIDILLRPADDADSGYEPIKSHRRLAFGAIVLLTASQILLGYPQYVFFSLAVESGYVLVVACLGQAYARNAVRGLGVWFAAVIVGALAGAVQLLPTIDSLWHSVRQSSAGADFATQGSMHVLNLTQLLAPYLFAQRVVGGITHEFGLYMGAVPLALAAWPLINSKNARRFYALKVAALACACLAVLWMLGSYGPLGWLESRLPIIDKFRLPCRAIVFFQLAVAVLAAIGFADIVDAGRRQFAENYRLLWALPIASATFTLLAVSIWNPYLGSAWLIAIGPILMAAAVFLVIRAAQGAKWAIAAIIVCTAIDLGAYGLSDSFFGHNQTLADYVATIDTPPGPPSQRVALDIVSGTEAAPGQKTVRTGDEILLAGWKRVDGYAGLDPAKRLDYREPAALRAAGVKWIAADAATHLINAVSPVEDFDSKKASNQWLRLRGSQPRAWLVPRAMASANPAADIKHISHADQALLDPAEFDAFSTITSHSLPIAPQPSDFKKRFSITTDSPGNLAFRTTCPTQQLLVIGESYHSGWQARVDGKSAHVFRADGDFMSVLAPPGEHEIRLFFQPTSLQIGRLASGFGLCLIVAMFLSAVPTKIAMRSPPTATDHRFT